MFPALGYEVMPSRHGLCSPVAGKPPRRALPDHQRHVVPTMVPSGRSIPTFQFE
jgi:hypothetical protein